MNLPISNTQLKNKLIQEDLISSEKFDAIVEEAKRKNENLIDKLVSEKVVELNFLNQFIAETLGIGVANISEMGVDDKVVKMLPEETARQRRGGPLRGGAGGAFFIERTDPRPPENI